MADDTQDKQLPASERKIRKARGEGQVARSRDLAHVLALGAGGVLLFTLAGPLADWLEHQLARSLSFDHQRLADTAAMGDALAEAGWPAAVIVLGLGVVMALIAVAAGVLSGGWNFTLKPLAPKLQKLDPIAGLGRLVSKHQLTEALKACLLACVLLTIGALYLNARLGDFPPLLAQPLVSGLAGAGDILRGGVMLLLLALAVFAIVDVPLQRWLLAQRLKMSHQEARQEVKEAEGNAEVKSKIRARMRQVATKRMLAAVPAADLVLMNPTHFAVALKYDQAGSGAPRVVAKGADLLAFRIRDAAEEARVPVLRSPPLARALYTHCEVDQEIPAALFGAVAQVLAWVFALRAAVAAGGAAPDAPQDVAVPDGFDPLAGRGAAAGAGA